MKNNIIQSEMDVKGSKINVIRVDGYEYISLTDLAKTQNDEAPADVVKNWLRNKETISFLGVWEELNNENFKVVEFDQFKNEAGRHAFTMSPQKWIRETNAIGIISKSGKYGGGTFARSDIAFEFASSIKSAYISILNDIKSNCFTKKLFISSQANRITKLIYDKYNVEPEFLWDDSPDYGVFRNKRSNKWFGIIMNIDKSKIIEYSNGLVEIINIKLDNVSNYLNIRGIYPAYHMNKKSWVSIILDDTLSDNEIMDLINISYDLINISTNYIIPANPKYYDIVSAFNDTDIIMWKQPKNILINDYVFLYIASPYSCIMYKCIVVDKDIPCQYRDNNINMDYIMKIKLIKKYNNEFTLDKLKAYGIKTIRGPRSVPPKLLKELK